MRTAELPELAKSGHALAMPLALDNDRPPRIYNGILYILSAFVAFAIVWAIITPIREIAPAVGRIVPAGAEQPVHHLEGGIVAEILAHEGDTVRVGAPLLRLQPQAAGSDLGQLEVRKAALMSQIARLDAMAAGAEPDFSMLRKSYPELARDQMEVYQADIVLARSDRSVLETRIAQREGETASLAAEADSLATQVKIKEEQLDIQAQLLKQGYTSKRLYLDIKSSLEAARAQLINTRGRLASARKALQEARDQMALLEANQKKSPREERSKAAAELAEVEQMLVKQRDRVARLVITAPVHGVVQQIVPKSTGEVVRPGELVAQIVPSNQELVAEVNLSPKDVGHVAVGDAVAVKVTAFDPGIFGSVDGVVRAISASTFQTERGETYYKVIIGLRQDHVEAQGYAHKLGAGMEVNADIITGAKSLMRYLLKPVTRSFDSAFSER